MAQTMALAKASAAAAAFQPRRTAAFLGTPVRAAARQTRAQAASARLVVLAADSAAVLEDVRKIIAEQLDKKLEEVTPESQFTDLGADSLDTVEIMMALEEKFKVQLDEENAEKVATVKDASELIASQISQ